MKQYNYLNETNNNINQSNLHLINKTLTNNNEKNLNKCLPLFKYNKTTTELIIEKTELHNWLMKILQCLANLFEFFSKTLIYQNLFSNIAYKVSLARKIYRIFKFLNEFPRFNYLIDCKYNTISKNLNFISRLFNCIFYFLENITLLQHIKILNENTLILLELIMSASFLLAQIFQGLYYYYILRKTYKDEAILKDMSYSQLNSKNIFYKLSLLSNIRYRIYCLFIKSFGDFVMACYDLKLYESLLSGKIFKFILSITGLMSSLVAVQQLFYY